MKTIYVTVPDGVYQDLQDYARQKGRSAEDLVRAAVETLKFSSKQQPAAGTSALSLKPLDLGKMLRPLVSDDDLLGEMLDVKTVLTLNADDFKVFGCFELPAI